jgi:hypothetical protein
LSEIMDYRKFQNAILAICVILAPLSLSIWFTLCPEYGNPTCPDSADPLLLASFRAAPPVLLSIFLIVSGFVPYVYPLSYLGLGLLAMKRSPWLATIGIIAGWIGSVPWGFIAEGQYWLNAISNIGNDTTLTAIKPFYLANGVILTVAGGWVIGHLFGYVFLGAALLRARSISRWASWMIIISAPIMGPLAYGLGSGYLQVAGFALVFVGSIPAAMALMRKTDNRNHNGPGSRSLAG